HDSQIRSEHYKVEGLQNSSLAHFTNFVNAATAGKPEDVNCSPHLGAAAMVIVKLGSQSYRQGKVFHFDRDKLAVANGDASWDPQWEKMSKDRAPVKHIPG